MTGFTDRMHQLSDEELISQSRAQAGSRSQPSCIDELFKRHQQRVALWCLRFTGDRESAADLAQDVMINAFRHLESFQNQSKFTTWLYVITRNHCMNHLKAGRGRFEVAAEDLLLEIPDLASENTDSRLARESTIAEARRLLHESLEETERQVFTLHFAEGMPLDAITRLLGLTNSSGAKAYVVSAKRKLETAVRRWRARNEARP